MTVSEALFGVSVGYFGWVRHYFGWVEVRGGVWGLIFGRLGCVGVSGTLF